MPTKTWTTNNICWYVMNSVFLRYGPFAMFVYVAWFEWEWKPRVALISASILVMLLINFVHKTCGHIISFYFLAIYQLDHFFILRMLKIVIYILMYFRVAKHYNLVWLRVYIPVAHSWNGILISKLYGHQTRGSIKEFTFLLVPPLADVIIEEAKSDDGIPFIRKFPHSMLFAAVILLGLISLLLPRVVPALPNDDVAAPADEDVPALANEDVQALAIDVQAPAIPPPPPPVVTNAIQADPVAARLVAANETAAATIAASPAVVAAATAADAAHEIVLIAAAVAGAATALVAADPDYLAAIAAETRAVAASARAVAAEDAAINVVGTTVADAAAAAEAAAAEPGRWNIPSMANDWWETIGDNCKDLCTPKKWYKWMNPGGLRYYEDFYKLM